MKVKFRSLLYIFALFIAEIPNTVYSQSIYEGQIIDKITELPIPAVTVILFKKHISTLANDQGYFKLSIDSVVAEDVLIFTSVGYQTIRLLIKDYTPYPYIRMQPTSATLSQVNIRAGKQKQITLDKFQVPNTSQYQITPVGIMVVNPRWTAKLFIAPTINAKLLRVQLGRQDYNDFFITKNKFARFILHVMDVDSVTGGPGRLLLTKEVTLQDNSHIVSIDLSKDKLILPSSKFFIAIEHLFIPYNEVVSIGAGQKVAGTDEKGRQVLDDTPMYFVEYQPFFTIYPQNHPVTLLHKNKDNLWVSKTIAGYTDSIALSATIIY